MKIGDIVGTNFYGCKGLKGLILSNVTGSMYLTSKWDYLVSITYADSQQFLHLNKLEINTID